MNNKTILNVLSLIDKSMGEYMIALQNKKPSIIQPIMNSANPNEIIEAQEQNHVLQSLMGLTPQSMMVGILSNAKDKLKEAYVLLEGNPSGTGGAVSAPEMDAFDPIFTGFSSLKQGIETIKKRLEQHDYNTVNSAIIARGVAICNLKLALYWFKMAEDYAKEERIELD